MKTAISLPDDLFAAAEALADRLGVSRSQLYATALARFVTERERAGITARLNAVYADLLDDAEERRGLARLQAYALGAARPDGAPAAGDPADGW